MAKPRCQAIPCESVLRVEFGKGDAWCFGHRHAPRRRPCDVARFCSLSRDGQWRDGIMVSEDEALHIIAGLTEVLRREATAREVACGRDHCSEWKRCENAKRSASGSRTARNRTSAGGGSKKSGGKKDGDSSPRRRQRRG